VADLLPVSPRKPVNSFDWIPVTPLSDSFQFAFWSEGGDIVYDLTARGGGSNLKWLELQRVDPANKHPHRRPPAALRIRRPARAGHGFGLESGCGERRKDHSGARQCQYEYLGRGPHRGMSEYRDVIAFTWVLLKLSYQ
jgi:hypothetical protein